MYKIIILLACIAQLAYLAYTVVWIIRVIRRDYKEIETKKQAISEETECFKKTLESETVIF